MTEKTTCPCKFTSLRLSSTTAAEFGDLHRVIETTSRNNHLDTALQLAAQHGHTAVTAYLLHRTTPSVDGLTTPLHRACFSGAVSTMRLILDVAVKNECLQELLLAPDASFGDQRNALQKAAAGGRFLAVHCLLEYGTQNHTTGLLHTARDAQGQTARDIAVSLRLRHAVEARSVARWNVVAGGPPDWDKCVQLLRRAEFQCNRPTSKSKNQWEPLAPHLLSSVESLSCADCSEPECLTKQWEESFRSVLGCEVEESLRNSATGDLFPVPETNHPRNDSVETHRVPPPKISNDTSSGSVHENALGQKCSSCHTLAIALYRRNGLLVCRNCR